MTVADRIAGIGYSPLVSPTSTVRAPRYVGRHRCWGTARLSRARMRYVARHLDTGFSPLTFAAALFR
jgi:hypothetical protein